MDMSKAFAAIDHHELMRPLRSKGLPDAFISMLSVMYTDHKAFAKGSSKFIIQRCVTQGNALSDVMFTCKLDIAFDMWQVSFVHETNLITHGL